ncbi:MAG TPA: carboxymuconolactone decarboxylase family protein [Candidatus Nitrosotalea sp.]|nr:carboxymuconolactone decarboxylase family protein [Candidatus Nitrosotalea sp.]
MDTYLAPIEKPKGLFMKQAYRMTKKRFGKVLTPLKVVYARLPAAFALFSSKISELDRKLELPAETAMLVREQVARINVCEFCIDIGRSITIRASLDQKKFDAIHDYKTSPLFSEAERAALDYVSELTREKQMKPETFARVAKHYSERAICELAWLVATEHYYNMVNIGLNIHSDLLCDIASKSKGTGAGR